MSAAQLPEKRLITRGEIVADLTAAGVNTGDVLLVHSALSRVGWLDGGPPEMVHALCEAIGTSGTLVIPTFTFNLASWGLPPFDPWNTPTRVGRLSDIFWRMPNVHRSHHPTHSVAAWGRLAAEIVSGPPDYHALGLGSPLDRARLAGAKILLIGVGQNRNSTIHLAESLAAMPYLPIGFSEDIPRETAWYLQTPRGQPQQIVLGDIPGSSEGFANLDEPLESLGIAKRIMIGDAPSLVMESEALCRTVVEMLRTDPLLLLRTATPSEITRRRLTHMRKRQTKGGNQ